MNKHCHHNCEHKSVKYCKDCNQVYCETCKETWEAKCTLPHYYYQTGSTTLTPNVTFTCGSGHAK